MQRQTENKIIVVIRGTRLAGLKRRFNTVPQAKFYVEHLGGNFGDYMDEDTRYQEAIEEAENALRPLGLVQFLDRAFLPNFVFGPGDTVVVLGQDGLVATTLKYTRGQPVLGRDHAPLGQERAGERADLVADRHARGDRSGLLRQLRPMHRQPQPPRALLEDRDARLGQAGPPRLADVCRHLSRP